MRRSKASEQHHAVKPEHLPFVGGNLEWQPRSHRFQTPVEPSTEKPGYMRSPSSPPGQPAPVREVVENHNPAGRLQYARGLFKDRTAVGSRTQDEMEDDHGHRSLTNRQLPAIAKQHVGRRQGPNSSRATQHVAGDVDRHQSSDFGQQWEIEAGPDANDEHGVGFPQSLKTLASDFAIGVRKEWVVNRRHPAVAALDSRNVPAVFFAHAWAQ